MNIAILIPTLTTGGAERAASELGNYLDTIGNKVYFFLLANSRKSFFDVSGEIVKTHISYPFDMSSDKTIIRELIFASRSLKKYKRKYKIDTCISFMEGCNILNICSRTIKGKVIVSVRTVLSERREYDGVFLYKKGLIKNAYRFADRVVAVSSDVRGDLISNYGVRKNKIVTIPNFSERRETNGLNEWTYGDKAVVCVGRMDPVKQFDSVMRSFVKVNQIEPNARLVFVGDGKQMNLMKALRKKLGLENVVEFAGFQKDVGAYLENATCFVMASKAEGFPNAMVEAMAYGVPIVSTDSPGGCREIIGRKEEVKGVVYCEYGIITPYIRRLEKEDDLIMDEENMLGDAILRVLSNSKLRDFYSERSKERSNYYSKENVMGLWKKILSV